MWPFQKKQEQNTAVALQEDPIRETFVEQEKEIEIPSYGEQVAGLTRFGQSWIRLEDVSAVDFEPSDGCGAEYTLKNGETMHMSEEDASALKAYLEGFEQVKKSVDSAS